MRAQVADELDLLEDLNAIAIALSAERDLARLLELILDKATAFTQADGGTIYMVTDDREGLRFEIMHTESLGIRMGGKSGVPIPLPDVPLRDADGRPNHRMVAAHAALTGRTVNIEDVYAAGGEFDFSGTREFDARTGYRSQSFLTVPMTNHENEVIGVLQLLNARDPVAGRVVPFLPRSQRLVEALASQAAVSITNRALIEAQRRLFDALIQLIANAIDEKSPYTGGHCRRVPVLTDLLAEAACRTTVGPLAGFTMNEEERYELNVAAWLHDCGKITTPEAVVDKATKLQAIHDRIELVSTRMEVLARDARIARLRAALAEAAGEAALAQVDGDVGQQAFEAELAEARAFLARVNEGGEYLAESDAARVRALAAFAYRAADGGTQPLLTDDETRNLLISRGTLTDDERHIINNHVVVTIKMLESLPYPRHLRRVPEYAGGHHERMDGSGYPQGLTREQMSIPARMVAIADIFEALTARDRPYKRPMPLSRALEILGRMRVEGHVDGDLFDVFVREQVWLRYAEGHLDPVQIDAVDLGRIPGFDPRAWDAA